MAAVDLRKGEMKHANDRRCTRALFYMLSKVHAGGFRPRRRITNLYIHGGTCQGSTVERSTNGSYPTLYFPSENCVIMSWIQVEQLAIRKRQDIS